jgi:hypothetical protein
MENAMQGWDTVPVTAALVLALAAAVLSSGPSVRYDLSRHLSEVFTPQITDLGR